MTKSPVYTKFTEHYRKAAFHLWYSAGRPALTELHKEIDIDKNNKKPLVSTLSLWKTEDGWDARADVLDAKAEAIVENDVINERVIMLRDQAARGKRLQTLGMDYLEDNDFDSSASALSAVIRGSDLERKSRGLSEHLQKVLEMPNDKLIAEVQNLIDRAQDSGEIIDMGESQEEDNAEDS